MSCGATFQKNFDESVVNDIYKNTFLLWQIYLKTFLENNNMLTYSICMVNMLIPLTWLHHMTFIQSLN